MKRVFVLGSVLLVGLVSLVAVSAEQGERVVEVEQVRDNLFVLRGAGGNAAAFVRSNGVVLVDTKTAGWGQPLIDAIGGLTSNPITTIINTHAHFDHVSGNVEFPSSVEIIAHENTKTLIDEWNPVTGLEGLDYPAVFDVSGGQGTPTRTFDDRLTIGSGNDQVDLYYFGRGHTGGDTWVVFPALRVMHAGDMFPGKQVPIMDQSNGGSGVEFARTLRLAHATVTDIDTVITGHSTVMVRADIAEMADFVDGFVADVRAQKLAGRSAAQIAQDWQPQPRFRTAYAVPGADRLQPYVQVIFDELDAQ